MFQAQSTVTKSCLKPDVQQELRAAGNHLGSMTFVGGRLVANGVDIVEELSEAFTSYENKNYRAFGKDMGTAWRKVLLSKPSSEGLPDPSPQAIEEVTEGLFSTFFGPGFGLQVETDSVPLPAQPGFLSAPQATVPKSAPQPQWAPGAAPAAVGAATPAARGVAPAAPGFAPAAPGAPAAVPGAVPAVPTVPSAIPNGVPSVPGLAVSPTEYPQTELNVDLHKCIAGNMPLLESAWSPVFKLAAQASDGTSTSPPSVSDLMMSMMDVQLALTRCNIGPAQEAMLIDAFESGGKIHTELSVPNQKVDASGVSSLLASALEDYKDERWFDFGAQLGSALQDMAVVGFPQKYEVDSVGRLRKKILGASELGNISSLQQPGSPLFVLSGAVTIGFFVLLALRTRSVITALWLGSSPHVYMLPSDTEAIE